MKTPIQGQKFSIETRLAKKNIRRLRLYADYSVNEGAALLGISRKQMEDVEATRNYGCHLTFDLLVKICNVYMIKLDTLLT